MERFIVNTNGLEFLAVLYREGPAWIAQCIEFDIMAQGYSPEDAASKLHNTVKAELGGKGKEALEHIGPAPLKYFN